MSIELFFRNLKYLFKYNIKHIGKFCSDDERFVRYGYIENMIENEKYLENDSIDKIKVLSTLDSIDYLLKHPVSFCRFGDGEISMIYKGEHGVFQKSNDKLRQHLKTVLESNHENIKVGINYFCYNNPQKIHDRQRLFYKMYAPDFRRQAEQFVDPSKIYLDSACTAPYHIYLPEYFDFKAYFDKFSLLWKDQDIVVICGKTVFKNIQHNIFDCAKSVDYLYGPSVNAYDDYDNLLKQALNTDKHKTKFIILGHTATVLAYDLALQGHRALDLGHLAKDFDSFMKQDIIDNRAICNFYDKD